MEQKSIFAFSHIPKTAGTTLNYLLRAYFKEKLLASIYRAGSLDNAYQYSNLKKDSRLYWNVKCISGHGLKPFVDFKEYNDRLVWFTFLRKPEKRFISHYVHQQTGSIPKYHMDLVNWASKYSRNDWMVKMIAGEENLNKAIDILEERFKFVGFSEDFDESLVYLKHELNWLDFNTYYNEPKMVIRDTSIKDKIYNNYSKYESCIKENNQLDDALYDYCRVHFWDNYQEKYKALEKTIDKTETYNKEKGILRFKLQNNLIYKPFVKIDNLFKIN